MTKCKECTATASTLLLFTYFVVQGAQALRRLTTALEEPNAFKLFSCIRFITDSTSRLVTLLKQLEGRDYFAVCIYNLMTDLQSSLVAGKSSCFTKYFNQINVRAVKTELQAKFIDAYNESSLKLQSYMDINNGNPSNSLFKAARIFDPRQVSSMSQNLEAYTVIKGLSTDNMQCLEEWPIYINIAKNTTVPQDFDCVKFWQDLRSTNRIPYICSVAIPVVMMPVTSVDVERSFSKTGQILTPQRHSLSDNNFKEMAALYFNGDIKAQNICE